MFLKSWKFMKKLRFWKKFHDFPRNGNANFPMHICITRCTNFYKLQKEIFFLESFLWRRRWIILKKLCPMIPNQLTSLLSQNRWEFRNISRDGEDDVLENEGKVRRPDVCRAQLQSNCKLVASGRRIETDFGNEVGKVVLVQVLQTPPQSPSNYLQNHNPNKLWIS